MTLSTSDDINFSITFATLKLLKPIIATFLDFSKAFRNINRILIKILKYIGIKNIAYMWFEFYFESNVNQTIGQFSSF